MPDVNIRNVEDPSGPGCELINQWLREYNWSANPGFMTKSEAEETYPLVLLADFGSQVVGGLFAQTHLAWLRISIMAVNPEMRGQGIGGALLAKAERQAVARGCNYAYVDTMEYQAPEFYQRYGYSIAGQLPNWDSQGHSKLHLIKALQPEGTISKLQR